MRQWSSLTLVWAETLAEAPVLSLFLCRFLFDLCLVHYAAIWSEVGTWPSRVAWTSAKKRFGFLDCMCRSPTSHLQGGILIEYSVMY